MRNRLATATNPFSSHRWETEVQHRIWIPPEASVIASPKACLISGMRGTGKTALLNCLDPLANARSAYTILNPEALPGNCIGVYMNIMTEFTDFLPLIFPDHQSAARDHAANIDRAYAQAFRAYLIFTVLARSLEVIDDCRRHGLLIYDAATERQFAEAVDRLWRKHFDVAPDQKPLITLLECSSRLFKVCMGIRINSLRLFGERVTDLIGGLQPIGFYRNFCELLINHGLLMREGSDDYHVKVSLDDVHRFSRTEQALLNGLLEVNTAPITWNLSFITNRYDPSLSPDPEAPLTSHDVETINLNYDNKPENFRQLCNRIFDMRTGVKHSSDDIDPYANMLGFPTTSVLFEALVKNTESYDFKNKIIEAATYVSETLSNRYYNDKSGKAPKKFDSNRYYYHAYIFLNLFSGDKVRFELFLKSRDPWRIRNYFRQKNVAALVCASIELGRSTLYAGTNTLMALSDGCVRDFLRIMTILYDNTSSGAHPKRRFHGPDYFSGQIQTPIPAYAQAMIFIEASRTYRDQVDASTDRVGRVLSSLVDGLGLLTRLLQSKDRVMALSLPERGEFQVNFAGATRLGDVDDRIALLRGALALGESVGAVRPLKGVFVPSAGVEATDKMLFRLHHLIAPAYGYSSRGPMRAVQIPLRFVLEFAEDRHINTRDWAERVFDHVHDLQGDSREDRPAQPELFD